METLQLVGSTLGLGLLAGTRLYATVLAVGLMVRFQLVALPAALADLQIFGDGRVLAAAGILYVIEFVADKVPWVDSLWDVVHTFIRPIGAAALGLAAVSATDRSTNVLMALAAGGVGLTAHATKAGARLLVNHSPEPFSNIGLSLAEDLAVPIAAWFVLAHPYIALAVVLGFLALFVWLAPKIFRLMRRSWAALAERARGLLSPRAA